KQQGSNDPPAIDICSVEEFQEEDIESLEEYEDIEQLLVAIEEVSISDKNKQEIPEQYREFEELFKDKAIGQLPPRRDYDHAIPIQDGKTVPFGPMYKLSPKELEELKKYIDEN